MDDGPAPLVLALAVLMSVVLPWVDSETGVQRRRRPGRRRSARRRDHPRPGPGLEPGQRRAHRPDALGRREHRVDRARPRQRAVLCARGALRRDGVGVAHTGQRDQRGRPRAGAHCADDRPQHRDDERQGVAGVAEDFVSVARRGSIVAFATWSRAQSASSDEQPTGEGVEIVVSGPSGAMSRRRDAIVSMIRSIRAAL